jgi:crossover junction endodeoxyribonuclease RuvC
MPHITQKILAIDPGTKEMGVALLESENLIYHSVHVIKNRASASDILAEGRKIVSRLLDDYRPDILAIENTFLSSKRTILLGIFTEEMKALGRKKGLKVEGYASNTVKKFIAGNGRATKDEVAQMIASKYPELRAYLNQNPKWKRLYHENMFDAVALALTCLNKLEICS